MAVVQIYGVKRDGSAATIDYVPAPTRIAWARGEGGTINLSVVGSDGEPIDLTGCTLVLALRPKGAVASPDPGPVLELTGTLGDDPTDGTATFALVTDDTIDLTERQTYRYDLQLTDGDDVRTQIVTESDWFVAPIVSTPPVEEEP